MLYEDLVITGTKGYLYAAAPWWQMSSFELRFLEANFEDWNTKQTFSIPTRGGGYRYDLAELVRSINAGTKDSYRFSAKDAVMIDRCIDQLRRV